MPSAPESRYVAEAPSNIAFIKYWGKRSEESQWPANASLSMTLERCRTRTCARRNPAGDDVVSLNGSPLPRTDPRAVRIQKHLDFLRRTGGFSGALAIETENTFPEGCGIASSASGFAALTLAAVANWSGSRTLDDLAERGFDRTRLAHWSRMGSGSSCRSLWGGYVAWHPGESPEEQLVEPFPAEWALSDVIVVVSAEEKPVSSREAHRAAWTSPLFRPRLAGISEKWEKLSQALRTRELGELGPLLEQEALEMHGVIMSASPATRYLPPRTIEVLEWLRRQRALGRLEAYFTLDAGPNVHAICRRDAAVYVRDAIARAFPETRQMIDETGTGPRLKADLADTDPKGL